MTAIIILILAIILAVMIVKVFSNMEDARSASAREYRAQLELAQYGAKPVEERREIEAEKYRITLMNRASFYHDVDAAIEVAGGTNPEALAKLKDYVENWRMQETLRRFDVRHVLDGIERLEARGGKNQS